MHRRRFLAWAGAGLAGAIIPQLTPAQTPNLAIRWLGHTCFLFTGSGLRILVNPFRNIGCTAGYRSITGTTADVVLLSSLLFDEGHIEGLAGNPRILTEPGLYQLPQLQVQGINVVKDRQEGRRFGRNVAWRWNQGGFNVLHLGSLASPITLEQQILMGRPDVLLIPVGGGPKAYTPQEALQAIDTLKPKLIIPTHFRTQAADPAACEILGVEEFLSRAGGNPIERASGDTIALTPASLPAQGSRIIVPAYQFAS